MVWNDGSVGRALGHVSEQTMLRQEMESLTNGIERRNMRSMQKQSYVCSAACCDDEDSTAQQFQRCMKTCSLPVERANAIFQNEMQRFSKDVFELPTKRMCDLLKTRGHDLSLICMCSSAHCTAKT